MLKVAVPKGPMRATYAKGPEKKGLIVRRIRDTDVPSALGNFGVKSGMRFVSVDGVDVTTWPSKKIAEMLRGKRDQDKVIVFDRAADTSIRENDTDRNRKKEKGATKYVRGSIPLASREELFRHFRLSRELVALQKRLGELADTKRSTPETHSADLESILVSKLRAEHASCIERSNLLDTEIQSLRTQGREDMEQCEREWKSRMNILKEETRRTIEEIQAKRTIESADDRVKIQDIERQRAEEETARLRESLDRAEAEAEAHAKGECDEIRALAESHASERENFRLEIETVSRKLARVQSNVYAVNERETVLLNELASEAATVQSTLHTSKLRASEFEEIESAMETRESEMRDRLWTELSSEIETCVAQQKEIRDIRERLKKRTSPTGASSFKHRAPSPIVVGDVSQITENDADDGDDLADLFVDSPTKKSVALTPREELEQILGRYSPRKLKNIPALLKKYEGREKALVRKVRAKYTHFDSAVL